MGALDYYGNRPLFGTGRGGVPGGGGSDMPAIYGITAAEGGDGSTGETYSLPAGTWAGVQWYRQQVAAPYTETAISGATGTTYVAQEADEGYRLVARGTRNGSPAAFKSYHVVAEPPKLLEDFETLTGWTATNGGLIDLVTDGVVHGTSRLRLTSTGTASAQATKDAILASPDDPSTWGTIAFSADLGMDAGRQSVQNHRVVLKRDGVDQYDANLTNTGTTFETPSPLMFGELWGCYHVSEIPGLATPGVSNMGLYVRQSGTGPYSQETKYDALLGKAGGRPTVILGFDDWLMTQRTNAFPEMQAREMPGICYFPSARLLSSSSYMKEADFDPMYAADWDCGLDSTHTDDITASFGTMAAAEESFLTGRAKAQELGWTRGNEHGCWTHGQYEEYPITPRVRLTTANFNGTTISVSSTAGITPGMRVVAHGVPNSPPTTVVSVNAGANTVEISAPAPTQTKPVYFVDEAHEFGTMKLPLHYRNVLGMRTMRTTRNYGGYLTRFGFGDRGCTNWGNAMHGNTHEQFVAKCELAILRGMTIEWYTHDVVTGAPSGSTELSVFIQNLNWLAAQRDAGLLDVMTWSQVWARDGNAGVPL